MNHFNEARKQCHGDLKYMKMEANWGLGCQVAPILSSELKKHLMDLLRAKMFVPTTYDVHCANQCHRDALDRDLNCITLAPFPHLMEETTYLKREICSTYWPRFLWTK